MLSSIKIQDSLTDNSDIIWQRQKQALYGVLYQQENTIIIYDIETGNKLHTLHINNQSNAFALHTTPKNYYFLVSSCISLSRLNLQILNKFNFLSIKSVSFNQENCINSMNFTFSPNGDYFLQTVNNKNNLMPVTHYNSKTLTKKAITFK